MNAHATIKSRLGLLLQRAVLLSLNPLRNLYFLFWAIYLGAGGIYTLVTADGWTDWAAFAGVPCLLFAFAYHEVGVQEALAARQALVESPNRVLAALVQELLPTARRTVQAVMVERADWGTLSQSERIRLALTDLPERSAMWERKGWMIAVVDAVLEEEAGRLFQSMARADLVVLTAPQQPQRAS